MSFKVNLNFATKSLEIEYLESNDATPTKANDTESSTTLSPEVDDSNMPPKKTRTYGKKAAATGPSSGSYRDFVALTRGEDDHPPQVTASNSLPQLPPVASQVSTTLRFPEPGHINEVENVAGREKSHVSVSNSNGKQGDTSSVTSKRIDQLNKAISEAQTSSPKPIGPSPDEIAEGFSTLKLSDPTIKDDTEFDISSLEPLVALYSDNEFPLEHVSWEAILPLECEIYKIAEASYAEIYRVTTSNASSIVKIMPLTVPHDPASLTRSFSSEIDDVISELQIMNVLTEIPGFVTFKGAKIVTGKQSEEFVEAWEDWNCGDHEKSQFDHPASYGKNATFLAIELGDAGEVLDEVTIDTVDKFWDVFLGTVIALARAETLHEFEHRDLHESNICIITNPVPEILPASEQWSKFDRSGLEVTIIDYGLSRAKFENGQVAFKNLENDMEIFQGTKGHPQFDTYRMMRSYLLTGETRKFPMTFHKRNSAIEAGKSWEQPVAYTNVLWLAYLLDYLDKKFSAPRIPKMTRRQASRLTIPEARSSSSNSLVYRGIGNGTSNPAFSRELPDDFHSAVLALYHLFNPTTSVQNGAFRTACDVLDFCVEMEWIHDWQVTSCYGGDPAKVKNYKTMKRKTKGKGKGKGKAKESS